MSKVTTIYEVRHTPLYDHTKVLVNIFFTTKHTAKEWLRDQQHIYEKYTDTTVTLFEGKYPTMLCKHKDGTESNYEVIPRDLWREVPQ